MAGADGVSDATEVAEPLAPVLPGALIPVVVAGDGEAVAGGAPATVGAVELDAAAAAADGFVVAGGADTTAAGGVTAGGFVAATGGAVALASLVASPAGELAGATGLAGEVASTTCVCSASGFARFGFRFGSVALGASGSSPIQAQAPSSPAITIASAKGRTRDRRSAAIGIRIPRNVYAESSTGVGGPKLAGSRALEAGLPSMAHRGATGQRHYNCLSSKRVQLLPPHSGASVPSRQVAQNQLDYRLTHQLPWMRPYDSGDYLTPAVGLAANRSPDDI